MEGHRQMGLILSACVNTGRAEVLDALQLFCNFYGKGISIFSDYSRGG